VSFHYTGAIVGESKILTRNLSRFEDITQSYCRRWAMLMPAPGAQQKHGRFSIS
jgi:hypothetical protein